jgi:hypothetical protein
LKARNRIGAHDSFRLAAEEGSAMSRALSSLRPVPRRGLSRDEEAMYVGVSAGKFDQMVKDGRKPAAVQVDGAKNLGPAAARSGV